MIDLERNGYMKFVDEKVSDLESYEADITRQPDHWDFWEQTIQFVRSKPLNEQLQKLGYPIKQIDAYDLSYHGFDETPIKAHYILPKNIVGKIPCLIFFHGYGGHKGSISDYMKWTIQGYAVIAVDARGHGETGDYSNYSTEEMGSWVTKGILNKEEYYYRKVYMDSVRAIDFACSREEVDPERIAIIGASFGGGITLAVAALDDRPKLAIADVPNMSNIELAIREKFEGSLTFVDRFLDRHPEHVERVFNTLSYFDNLNLCEHIKCKVRVSVGLKDPICPPKSIYGVYNQIKSEKSMIVYPFSEHHVHHVEHVDNMLQYVNENL